MFIFCFSSVLFILYRAYYLYDKLFRLSRTMILSVRGLSVLKDGGKVQARIAGLTVEDQGQRFSIRTSLLVLSYEVGYYHSLIQEG